MVWALSGPGAPPAAPDPASAVVGDFPRPVVEIPQARQACAAHGALDAELVICILRVRTPAAKSPKSRMLFGAVTGAVRAGQSCSMPFRRGECTESIARTHQVAGTCASSGIWATLGAFMLWNGLNWVEI